jgi:hypothetical protein
LQLCGVMCVPVYWELGSVNHFFLAELVHLEKLKMLNRGQAHLPPPWSQVRYGAGKCVWTGTLQQILRGNEAPLTML